MRIKQLTAGAFAVLLAAYGGDISAFEMPIMGGAGTSAVLETFFGTGP